MRALRSWDGRLQQVARWEWCVAGTHRSRFVFRGKSRHVPGRGQIMLEAERLGNTPPAIVQKIAIRLHSWDFAMLLDHA